LIGKQRTRVLHDEGRWGITTSIVGKKQAHSGSLTHITIDVDEIEPYFTPPHTSYPIPYSEKTALTPSGSFGAVLAARPASI
jgi:hypothetical protein